MVFTLRVLKLDVQTVLYSHIHLDTAVDLWRNAVGVYPDVLFTDDILNAAGHGSADEVAQFYVDAVVGFVLFLDGFEVERESLWVLEFTWRGE